MKKISKSNPPNAITRFYGLYPNETWNNFRDYNTGNDYKGIKEIIFTDQGQICAYCETSLKNAQPDKQKIEHYHSKSDNTNPAENWALNWDNLIGVCTGGTDSGGSHPLPKNLSCDSHKAHFEDKNKLPIPCDGYVLDPLAMIATPALFDFDKLTGELIVNATACAVYEPELNVYPSVIELVENTINVFNLNCDRLNEIRLKIFHEYERIIKKARIINDTEIHSKITKRWFDERWPSYFTTRRVILGHHAEKYLTDIRYEG